MIGAIATALTGLNSASKKIEASAANIANINTVGALDEVNGQKPFSAVTTIQKALDTGGVQTNIVQKDPGFVPAFDNNSPFANEEGVIGLPNVNLAEEATNLILAKNTYKANAAVIKVSADLQEDLLNTIHKDK